MPSITTILTVLTFSLSSLVAATPIDPSTQSLNERANGATWRWGTSKCPDDDGDYLHPTEGGIWRIRCGRDTVEGGSLSSSPGNVDFRTCIKKCAANSKCKRVTFIGNLTEEGPCSHKGDTNSDLKPVSGHLVATKISD